MIAKVAPPSQASPFGATSNCIYILLIVNNILVYCTCICQFGNKLLLLLLLQLAPAVTLVEQLRMPCGVCKSNDMNDTLLSVLLRTLQYIVYVVYSST